MHWQDDGIVLSVRRLGETNAVVNLLTPGYGRHAGLVRGGAGRKLKGILQPGNELRVEWRSRLAEQLGTFAVELKTARIAHLLDDPLKLAGLSSACAMTEAALPEREAHPAIYEGFRALLNGFDAQDKYGWAFVYVRWELGLMTELGFGLDLAKCAATGATLNLTHVSPRSGRAVSAAAAQPYADRLLRLPAFLSSSDDRGMDVDPLIDILDGLQLTGFFLERNVLNHNEKPLPPARGRLIESFTRLLQRHGVKAHYD